MEVFLSVCMCMCVCVYMADREGQFTFIIMQMWTQRVNQTRPVEALVAEYKVFSLLDEARACPVHDVLHFQLSAMPWGRTGRGQGRE